MSIKIIVLVHGAFLDGSSWRKVIPLLTARGLTATAVQNSLTSLPDDAATVRRAIEAQDGPVMLVGQSYGGTVISEAGNHPQVAGLVYVAASAPEDGQTTNEWWSGYAAGAATAELRTHGDGFVMLSADGVRKYLVQDLPTEEADIVYATQRPLGGECLGGRVSTTAWRTKPSWFIVATHDHVIPPAVQQEAAERMGAEILVLQVGHVPMLSQPEAVASFIANAAASFGD